MSYSGFRHDYENDGPPRRNHRPRYGDAYGDYRGGYGPGGGYGPPRMPSPRPLMPPMPPPAYGRPMRNPGPIRVRFGSGPPKRSAEDEKAIKYLIRCGVDQESLKSLSRDVLMLMHSDHCGICGVDFETFTLSRIHYISKNHSKSLKKMLAKPSSGSTTEMPIKARDLYCELCDVQITSKVHGDAHYAGKQHRGVVEGRKNPKNPLLIQPHMEWRLNQLIRREKRVYYKDKKEEEAPKDEETPEKPRVPPELYCDICKTSMTCSEQMTMHMNGRRHLAKEKHHILTMMKGAKVVVEKAEKKSEEEKSDEEDDAADKDGDAADALQDVDFIEKWESES